MDLVRGQPLAALQVRQLDDDGDADNLGANLLHQLAGGLHRAAGGEQIIDQQDLGARGMVSRCISMQSVPYSSA